MKVKSKMRLFKKRDLLEIWLDLVEAEQMMAKTRSLVYALDKVKLEREFCKVWQKLPDGDEAKERYRKYGTYFLKTLEVAVHRRAERLIDGLKK